VRVKLLGLRPWPVAAASVVVPAGLRGSALDEVQVILLAGYVYIWAKVLLSRLLSLSLSLSLPKPASRHTSISLPVCVCVHSVDPFFSLREVG